MVSGSISLPCSGFFSPFPHGTGSLSVSYTHLHIHWFVTEHGAVDLYGKTLQERARLIISVADPSAQEELDRAAFERSARTTTM